MAVDEARRSGLTTQRVGVSVCILLALLPPLTLRARTAPTASAIPLGLRAVVAAPVAASEGSVARMFSSLPVK